VSHKEESIAGHVGVIGFIKSRERNTGGRKPGSRERVLL
jgi:hypothetical protein